MSRIKKEITLYNVLFPIWFLLMFPVTWIVVLPVNFIIDSAVLLICAKLLNLTGIRETYKRSIIKIWIIGFASDFIGAGILFLSLDSSGSWYEYLQAVSWNPFDNWYALLFVAFAVAVAGVCIFIGNLKYALRKVEASQRKKRILALCLAVLTAPYILFYPSSLLHGNSWSELRFMTNHIVKMDEFRMEVALGGLPAEDSGPGDTIIMYDYERDMKDAINEAKKTDDFTAGYSNEPSFTLLFYNRYYTNTKAIPVWMKDDQGFFQYKNAWYAMDKDQIDSFLEGFRDVQNTRGKKEFDLIPDPRNELSGIGADREDKEGRKLSEYPIFEDSKYLYYSSEREKFDGVMVHFEGREGIEVRKALETGLVTPQNLIDHGLELVIEKREWKVDE